ncbi:hypothetical protein WM40_12305 [Robbsia andropogonis]|uniref:Uncharacterized protein n=1 Tax=Robbsia andropogonis TaxID=28092 RepID=A0A0F5JZM6_9BURK|nr:hypothetical protein [Robbsia andropogonis]KKB63283.1 hypothetical protein WM40_12305 [Robbsia andropogonis]
MKGRITSLHGSPTEAGTDTNAAPKDAATSNARLTRPIGAGLMGGPGNASPRQRPAVSTLLRRTVSHSHAMERMAALSRNFQREQETTGAARPEPAAETPVRPAAPAPVKAAQIESSQARPQLTPLSQPTAASTTSSASAVATRPSETGSEPYGQTQHAPTPHPQFATPYPAPYGQAMHWPAWHPQFATPYQAPSHWQWTASHGNDVMSPSYFHHAYQGYAPAVQPSWAVPTYHNWVVGAKRRFGLAFGGGDGPNGAQMHAGFHFNGRFHLFTFGLYPSATKPFFLSTQSGRMHPPHTPALAQHPYPPPQSYQANPLHITRGGTDPVHDPAAYARASRPWTTVLGITEEHATSQLITQRYREKRRRLLNTDGPTNWVGFLELAVARENALKALAARIAGTSKMETSTHSN